MPAWLEAVGTVRNCPKAFEFTFFFLFFLSYSFLLTCIIFVKNWHYFFHKYLVEFINEATWTLSFLCGKVSKFNSLFNIRLFKLLLSSYVAFGSSFLPKWICSFHLSCWIYFHKVIHYVVYILKISVEYIDFTSFITGISHFVFSLFFW